MGLGDTLFRFGDAAIQLTQQLTLDTLNYVAWHGFPYYVRVSDLLDEHPLIVDLWRGASRILVQDVGAIVFWQAANRGTETLLAEYNNPLVESFKWGVWGATNLVVFTRAAEGAARTVVLGVKAGSLLAGLTNDNTTRYKQLCEDCSPLRFLLGSGRDYVAYLATEFLIAHIDYLPFIQYSPVEGEVGARAASLWNSAGYVCATVLPICNRHLVENKQQHPTFLFAIGLHHALMTALLSGLVQGITQLPGAGARILQEGATFSMEIPKDHKAHYQPYLVLIGQLCLLVEMMLVAKMKWPEPVGEATRYFFNPLMLFQRAVGILFDTLAKGSKKTILPLLKTANHDKAVWVENTVQRLWSHPLWHDRRLNQPQVQKMLSWVSWLILPEMLYQEGGLAKASMIGPKGSFAQDSVIGPSWNQWREEIIAAIDRLQEKRKESLIQLLGWAASYKSNASADQTALAKLNQIAKYTVKEIASRVVVIAGHPEANEFGWGLLKAINDDFILRMLSYLRAGLEGKELPGGGVGDAPISDGLLAPTSTHDLQSQSPRPIGNSKTAREVITMEASSGSLVLPQSRANSQTARALLSVEKGASPKGAPVDPRAVLGLTRRHGLFTDSQKTERNCPSPSGSLEENLQDAMGEGSDTLDIHRKAVNQ